MTAHRLIAAIAAIALAGLAATGCGRRADLDTPSQAAARDATQSRISNKEESGTDAKPAKDKPFILDTLIE